MDVLLDVAYAALLKTFPRLTLNLNRHNQLIRTRQSSKQESHKENDLINDEEK